MRRQWPCSKCGFACSSTWRNLYPAKPVICNTCKSKEKNKINAMHNIIHPPPGQIGINMNNSDGVTNINIPSQNSSFYHKHQINPSHIVQQNMSFTVSEIGMIFGNLPLEPLAIPVNVVRGGRQPQPSISPLQEPKLRSKRAVKEEEEEDREIGVIGDHFYCGSTTRSLKTSTSVLEGGKMIQIKHEYDCRQTILEAQNLPTYGPNKVQKKRRSKLPQYTLSPLARLIKQLHHVYHSNIHKVIISTKRRNITPKYDDVLIYEKCKYVSENEIGLGAKSLSVSPVVPVMNDHSWKNKERFWRSEYYNSCAYSTRASSSSSGGFSNCLVDVPITSSPSSQ